MNKILFKESQQFRQWWRIVLILGSTVSPMCFSIYALYQQTARGIQVGNSAAPNVVMIGVIVASLIAIWVFFSMKFDVMIDKAGIHFRFSPLIRKTRLISREDIQRFEIRKYKPIIDYGGWGIKKRYKWGKAYNVSGNIGLQLYLKNGRKILFGTQRSQAIIYAMDEMMKPMILRLK